MADALGELLHESVEVVRDPEAHLAVQGFEIETTPFAFEIRDRRVSAKAALRSASHLLDFMAEPEDVPSALQPEVMVYGE